MQEARILTVPAPRRFTENSGVEMSRLAACVLGLLSASTPTWAQGSRDWTTREFGVGVVRYADMYRYEARDVIYAAPDRAADTVAVLDREELCFHPAGECGRSYQRMIEFDYEVPGFAILGFNEDSSWARVTLDPYDSVAPPEGWVELPPPNVFRTSDVRAVLWRDLLPEHPLFFLRSDDIRFYARAGSGTPARVALATTGQRLDYLLYPLTARGRWLQVEVESPSTFCRDPIPAARRDTLWIEYLTEDMRPRVFFFTRGC